MALGKSCGDTVHSQLPFLFFFPSERRAFTPLRKPILKTPVRVLYGVGSVHYVAKIRRTTDARSLKKNFA